MKSLPGVARDIAGFRVEFFRAEHRVPTVAVRVFVDRKTFAFSADTLACDEIVACARNADLFLCDTLCADLDGEAAAASAWSSMHATAREAAAMATRAGAGALACTHIARFTNPTNILAEAEASFAGAVKVRPVPHLKNECGSRSLGYIDGHTSNETSKKSSWLKVTKVARCTRTCTATIRSSRWRSLCFGLSAARSASGNRGESRAGRRSAPRVRTRF
jgi:hypothetical protein